jgi:hypothetical protein
MINGFSPNWSILRSRLLRRPGWEKGASENPGPEGPALGLPLEGDKLALLLIRQGLLATRSLRSLDPPARKASARQAHTDFLLCRSQLNVDKGFNGAGNGKAKGATLRETPYERVFTQSVMTFSVPQVAGLKCPRGSVAKYHISL